MRPALIRREPFEDHDEQLSWNADVVILAVALISSICGGRPLFAGSGLSPSVRSFDHADLPPDGQDQNFASQDCPPPGTEVAIAICECTGASCSGNATGRDCVRDYEPLRLPSSVGRRHAGTGAGESWVCEVRIMPKFITSGMANGPATIAHRGPLGSQRAHRATRNCPSRDDGVLVRV